MTVQGEGRLRPCLLQTSQAAVSSQGGWSWLRGRGRNSMRSPWGSMAPGSAAMASLLLIFRDHRLTGTGCLAPTPTPSAFSSLSLLLKLERIPGRGVRQTWAQKLTLLLPTVNPSEPPFPVWKPETLLPGTWGRADSKSVDIDNLLKF